MALPVADLPSKRTDLTAERLVCCVVNQLSAAPPKASQCGRCSSAGKGNNRVDSVPDYNAT
jgi:hypothetical protein